MNIDDVTIGISAEFQGAIKAGGENGTFQVVQDQILQRTFDPLPYQTLRARIVQEFNIPESNLYVVNYGVINTGIYTGRIFDLILYDSNDIRFPTRFYLNGNIIFSFAPNEIIPSLTISMGTNNMIMVYDAPASTTRQNGVYKTYIPSSGVYLLAVLS